jgi:hypothetical protein
MAISNRRPETKLEHQEQEMIASRTKSPAMENWKIENCTL